MITPLEQVIAYGFLLSLPLLLIAVVALVWWGRDR